MTEALIVAVVLAALVILIVAKTAVVVPQQSAYVVERLGKYRETLGAGFHILIPFFDAVRYKHSLKEAAVDIPEQVCITRDNVQVHVDGVLYLKVLNPERASYGVLDYLFAISQLAQTTLRSEMGKIDLDRTFEERTHINIQVVSELDKASEPWGIKMLRYEIKNITPPTDVLAAMEKQMRAEREKRAVILTSEGERDAAINSAEGQKQQVIKASEARKQQQINEAEGAAAAILSIARATAEGIRQVAGSIQVPGGSEAVQLRVAEQYLTKFGELANASDTTMIVPASVADVASMIGMAMNVIRRQTPRARRRERIKTVWQGRGARECCATTQEVADAAVRRRSRPLPAGRRVRRGVPDPDHRAAPRGRDAACPGRGRGGVPALRPLCRRLPFRRDHPRRHPARAASPGAGRPGCSGRSRSRISSGPGARSGPSRLTRSLARRSSRCSTSPASPHPRRTASRSPG